MSMSHGTQKAVFDESTAAQFVVVLNPKGNQKIRVRGLFLSAVGVQRAVFESNSTSLGAVHLSAGNIAQLGLTEGGVGDAWMETAVDEDLRITLDQAVQTDGVVFYDIVAIKTT